MSADTLSRVFPLLLTLLFGSFSTLSLSAEELANDPGVEVVEPASPVVQATNKSSHSMGGMVGSVQDRADVFARELSDLKQGLQSLPQQWDRLLNTLTHGQGWDALPNLLMMLGLMIGIGWLLEKLATLKLGALQRKLDSLQEDRWYVRLGYLLLGSLFGMAALAVFTIAAIIVPVSVYDPGEPPRMLLISVLAVIVTVRFVAILARVILAPWAKGIRPLPLECPQARRFYYWTLVLALVSTLITHVAGLLLALGMQGELVRAMVVFFGLFFVLLLVCLGWFERVAINQMFAEGLAPGKSPIRQMISQSWPILMTAWLLLLWGIWGFNVFLENHAQVARIRIAWWVTIMSPVLDRLVFALLSKIASLPALQAGNFPQRASRMVAILLNGFRALLVAVILIALSEAWGFGTFDMMQSSAARLVLSRIGEILVISLLAYVAWEAVRIMIEQRMPNEPDEDDVSLEGDGGGGGATRTETLLPLLRSFIYAVLVVVVALTVLHSMGIEIGPLIAGAGVVGIAVGFGAQKLVQDVISGIFFLLDDAFRRGEYIEAGSLRGTVEKISMRSMRLRHHLGAVQTIPYGEIATVKNLSRDWITMKLELRLPYDTDIEKVRKIIKRVGQEMLKDEEMGPNFILPLKSQGVMRVEESALIIRMKFTSKPGEQWIIRREAYRRVRDGLQEAGINFAHREVTVRMPEEHEHAAEHAAPPQPTVAGDQKAANNPEQGAGESAAPTSKTREMAEQAAAAITTAVIATELQRQQKLDGADDADDEM